MAGSVDQLTIHLLGTPEARIAGRPLALHHQKARALLYYLAATERPHTRDHLAALLWSESPESNARHSLRSSLYHIRQALHAQGAGEALVGDGELIHLRLNQEACDVASFRRLLAEGSEQVLARAAALYQGPLLRGFMIDDAPLFEDWLRVEGHGLAQAYLTMLQRLASWAEKQQDWNQAISYMQNIVQLEPLAEEMQQQLISLYLRIGAIGQALRQYHQLETELWHELGLTPSLETQAVLSSALTLRHGTSAFHRGGSGADGWKGSLRRPGSEVNGTEEQDKGNALPAGTYALPFVGRDEEFKKLIAISQAASAGRGCALLIQGEDGSGRRRVLHELAALLLASQPGWMILQGSCSPFDDLLSYGPFLEAFQNATPGDLSDLLSHVREADESEQGRFLWSMLQALQLLTRDAPLLLTIDDLQWANSPTLRLFGFLATRLRNLPVLLVGTVQRAEAVPALQRLLTLGRRHGDVHLLSLSHLTLEAVATLTSNLGIETVSDTWAATTFSQWLYERSSGSPFILAEIIAQLQAEQILISHAAGLRLDASRWRRWRATFTLPETSHDLVAWRLTNLASLARMVLDVLAVANQPLPFKLLHEFPCMQDDQLLATIDELEARGLVTESESELLSLSHNLLREALLHQLSHLRRQDIHRQLARLIEQCPVLQRQLPLRQLAIHAVAGEDGERARRYGLQILDELVQENANPQTATFLRHLHDLLAPIATPHELLRLTSALGRVHQSLAQLEESASWHHEHLELANKITDLPAKAAVHFELSELALVANDYQGAVSEARAGLSVELPAEDALLRVLMARGQRLLGAALAMEGSDLSSAEYHLQQAVEGLHLTDNRSDLSATLFELGNIAAQRGEIEHALDLYQEAARTAEAARAYYFLALSRNNFAYHNLLLGRLEEARKALAAGTKLAERYEMFGALMHLSSTRGEIHLYAAEWQAAIEAFQHSLALAEELRNLERQAGNRAGLALAARGQENLAMAQTYFEEALALITEHAYWHLRTRIQLWLAETLLLNGKIDRAEPFLQTALATAQTHGRQLLLAHGERLSAYLLAAHGDWPEANACFSQALERASYLHLPLEVARAKALWGQALMRYAPLPHNGHTLLSKARDIFTSHNAFGDLHLIEGATRTHH